MEKQNVRYFDKFVRNKRKKYNNNAPADTDEIKNISWIDAVAENSCTVDDCLSSILINIAADDTYYSKISKILKDFKVMLKRFTKYEFDLEIFGSAVTKLALKDSDIDVFVNFGDNLPESPEEILKKLKKSVYKYFCFSNPVSILSKTPLLKCNHHSGISCDITFLNKFGTTNSSVVSFLLETDKRLRPFLLILKFLIKKEGVLNSSCITSFGLTSLAIYFFQQLERPLLPTIQHLQSLESSERIIENWNTSFSTNLCKMEKTECKMSVVDLLREFFKFYSTFEFAFYVISTFTGKQYLKPVFSNTQNFPEEFSRYKANFINDKSLKFCIDKCMCVQSFFRHSRNVTAGVRPEVLVRFQKVCHQNAKILEVDFKNVKEALIKLFKQPAIPYDKKRMKSDCVLYFTYSNENMGSNFTERDLRNNWYRGILAKVLFILEKILKCKVHRSITTDSDCNPSECYDCELVYFPLVTKLRKSCKITDSLSKNYNILEREKLISDYLLKNNIKDSEKVSLKFFIFCTLIKSPTKVWIKFKGREKKVEVIESFFIKSCCKWIY